MPDLPERVGGRLALDFVNTVDGRHDPGPKEFLPDYATFLDWVEGLDTAVPTPAARLRELAAADPAAAATTYDRVTTLREALFAVFEAAIEGRAVGDEDLATVNRELCAATDHHVLRPAEGGGVRDGWDEADALESPLWPIVVDAWDVLTNPIVARVKECPGHECAWLFLDTSKSGTRRWCDMRTCGNRAKARNHYERTRS